MSIAPHRLRALARGLACAAVLGTAGTVVAAPSADTLAARDRALGRAEARLEARMAQERAALAATRARVESLRARYETQMSRVRARLRAAYAQPAVSPIVAILAGAPGEAERQAQLTAALGRADARMIRDLRDSLGELRRAESAMDRRKRALAAEHRMLAARRAAVRTRLRGARRAEAAARAADRTGTPTAASLLPVLAAPTTTAAAGTRGLPAEFLRTRSLPGAAPVDARTGEPVSLDAPATGAGQSVALPGQGIVTPGAAPAGAGGRFTVMVGIRPADPAGRRTASGVPFAGDTMVAVHRTLPLGALVRLRRGSHEVVVRVVDRGPWVASRDMDISPAAASALDLGRAGPAEAQLLGG